jgi:exopolysaccharide biosynthesis polyprenyl glycosylphosphotransferase
MRKIILLCLDIALLYGSLLAMLALRYDDSLAIQYHLHLLPFGIIFGIWLVVFYIANLYDPRTLRNSIFFYSRLFEAIAVAAVISTSFFYLIPFFGITPKTNLAVFIIIFAALAVAARSLFNSVVETRFKKSVLIVGNNAQTKELADFITLHPQLGYTLKGLINSDDTARLAEAVQSGDLDTIVISPDVYHLSSITTIFYKSLRNKINFYSLATFYEQLTGRVPLGVINQIWFLENLSEGNKRAYEAIKRGADVLFGLIFGIISLVLYPFIALAIQLSSPGPIFYTQERIGQLGKPFNMLKFRTMIPNAEAGTGAVWTQDGDSRITRVGKFLRRSRIDELPQLWNIIRGDMSLVGPRAERPEFHATLKQEVPFYEERYLIKPGLSGWAQINFHYGSSIADAAEKLKYDLYYIKNRSFLLDVGIVLKTIRIAISQAGK